MPDPLITSVRRGALWSTAAAVFNTFWTFVFSIILARLLRPEDFGRAAMATFFVGTAGAISGLSFGIALVNHRDTDDRDLNGVFWTTLGMASALSLALVVGAPLIAQFYAEPMLTELVRIWSIVLVLNNLNIVPDALLQREMRISVLSRIHATGGVAHGVVACGSAYLGAGVFSLAYAQIGQLITLLLIKWWLVRWRPGFTTGGARFAALERYAWLHMAGDLLGSLTASWDNMLVGRLLGSAPLGFYRRARSLPDQVLHVMMQVSRELMFPTFSHAQHDQARARNLVLRSVSLTAGLVCPLLVGLGAVAHEVIAVLYGPKWSATAPLMQITVVGLLFATAGAPIGMLFDSHGRADLRLRLSGVMAVVGSALYAVAAYAGGIEWVAWAFVIMLSVQFVLRCTIAGALVGIRIRDVVVLLVKPLACALGMLVAVLLVRVALQGAAPALVLGVTVPVGAAVYAALAFSLRIEALSLLRSWLRRAESEGSA